MANDNDLELPDDDADASPSVVPRSNEDRREIFIKSLGQAVLDALAGGSVHASANSLAEPLSSQSTSADEFVQALDRLNDAGWKFDTSYPAARLIQYKKQMSQENLAVLDEVRDAHPLFPYEVADVVFSVLTGNQPESERLDSPEERASRRAAVERHVITDSTREAFFLRECGKVPRFATLDWEVVAKVAERGHRKSPDFAYALMKLDTIKDSHGEHEHESIAFATGPVGLKRLIDELSQLLDQLEYASEKLAAGKGSTGT